MSVLYDHVIGELLRKVQLSKHALLLVPAIR